MPAPLAQQAQPGAQPGSLLGGMMLPLVMIGLLFFFMVLRPQQAEQRKREELLKQIKKKEAAMLAQINKVIEVLKESPVKVGAKVGTSGKIFGSVTTVQIARAIRDPNFRIFAERGAVHVVGAGLHLESRDPFALFKDLGAAGRTDVHDAEDLRAKESDRLATMAAVLRAFGGDVVELQDGLTIHGGRPLRAAHVESHGDHRVAMSAVVLGLVADGETIVDDVACVDATARARL